MKAWPHFRVIVQGNFPGADGQLQAESAGAHPDTATRRTPSSSNMATKQSKKERGKEGGREGAGGTFPTR